MQKFATINFQKWIDQNRHELKPPVGNKLLWKDRELIVMVVGGPNTRTDYHVNPGEEFFYQLEGSITLKVVDNNKLVDISIAEGEVFLLPPYVPHSPRRPANTIGLVVEHKRQPHELDGFQWYCPNCNKKLYEEFFQLTNIEKQFPPIFDRFFSSEENTTCKSCQTKMVRPDAKD